MVVTQKRQPEYGIHLKNHQFFASHSVHCTWPYQSSSGPEKALLEALGNSLGPIICLICPVNASLVFSWLFGAQVDIVAPFGGSSRPLRVNGYICPSSNLWVMLTDWVYCQSSSGTGLIQITLS